jgi:YD repeat-containing protein
VTAYTYIANSPLVGQITLKSNATTRLTVTKSYDYLNRLSSISSAFSAASALSFSSSYNDANQRVQVAQADGSFWQYEYDNLGQSTKSRRSQKVGGVTSSLLTISIGCRSDPHC